MGGGAEPLKRVLARNSKGDILLDLPVSEMIANSRDEGVKRALLDSDGKGDPLVYVNILYI